MCNNRCIFLEKRVRGLPSTLQTGPRSTGLLPRIESRLLEEGPSRRKEAQSQETWSNDARWGFFPNRWCLSQPQTNDCSYSGLIPGQEKKMFSCLSPLSYFLLCPTLGKPRWLWVPTSCSDTWLQSSTKDKRGIVFKVMQSSKLLFSTYFIEWLL